jgi:hypothetical protein
MDLRSAIESRRSIRQYAGDPLTLQELAYLLWCTPGILQRHEPYATFRNVPSAGGRHAFGAFDDELMAGLIGIDRPEEFVIYCATVGKK